MVDDEDLALRVANLALSRHGYTVIPAASAPQAIEILRREKDRMALVLLDLSMPGMNGLELLPELRKIKPDVKVMLSSGYGEEQTMGLFAGQQIAGLLRKPYASAKLARAVNAVLRHGGAGSR